MNKIITGAKNNNLAFNEEKSKAMLITRSKRKENKEISVYMNKFIEQVQKNKHFRIIIDSKLNFREHLYTSSKCTNLIHALSKSAKQRGLSHAALHTIYKGAILLIMLYGAPVWIQVLKKEYKKTVYNRVLRLVNIKIAKAFRTTSNEALCILTCLTPIVIKAEEAAKLYNTMSKNQAHEIDHEVQPKDWLHPADSVLITDQEDELAIQIFTDGSKSELGVRAGIAIFVHNIREYQ
jgi:hypothetical protein